MSPQNKYFAFISYKREDEEWAIWLQHELEYYHLPALLNGREDLPKVFRPVFRDIDELKAGNLPEQIHEALATSSYLIVICSPRSAKSEWVNKEVETFLEIGKEQGVNHLERIFPFIVDGTPHAKDETQECFPKVLRDLPADQERIGGNVNESGRDKAFIKVMAGMLPNVGMDMLWNRYERDKAEEERKKREERDRLLIMQSRFISEKANNLIDQDSYLARLLALEALPKDLLNPDRPYILEAERTLRLAHSHHSAILRGHNAAVNTAFYSPDGKTIVSSSRDKTVRVWDVETGVVLQSYRHNRIVNSASFSSDGKSIISTTTDHIIHFWDIKTGKETIIKEEDTPPLFSCTSSPNNSCKIVPKGNTIRIIDIGTIAGTIHSIDNKAVYFATISPNEKYIVAKSRDRHIHIWDIKENKELQPIKGQFIRTPSSPFSQDGKRFVTTSITNNISIWDAETRQETHSINANHPVVAASFSPKQNHFAFATNDGVLHFWDLDNNKEIQSIAGRAKTVFSISYDPKGERIITASSDKAIHILDADTGRELGTLKGHHDAVVFATFSHNGRQIVSSSIDNTIRVWDTDSLKELNSLDYLTDDVKSISFDHDGKHFVSTSKDMTVRVWDVETGKEIQTFVGHTADINSTIFSHNGKQIISTDNTGTMIIWPFPPLQELIDQTRERFKDRPLTTEERKMYYIE